MTHLISNEGPPDPVYEKLEQTFSRGDIVTLTLAIVAITLEPARLTVRAQVPGLEAALFDQMVGRAADLCRVSDALRGNVEISVRSELTPSVEATAKPRRQGAS